MADHHEENPFAKFLDDNASSLEDAAAREFEKKMADHSKRENFGATGRHPAGKLNEHDLGELQFGITSYRGNVVMNFGTPVSAIAFSVEQANAIISGIEQAIEQIERER